MYGMTLSMFVWDGISDEYPLTEFSYDNLDLLAHMRQPCQNITEMLQDLVTLLTAELR